MAVLCYIPRCLSHSVCRLAGHHQAGRLWSGRLLDDASDQYRRPASHWPLLLGAAENRSGDDGRGEDVAQEKGRKERDSYYVVAVEPDEDGN